MFSYFEAVKEFHETFKVPAPDHVTLCPTGPENASSLCNLRIRLLQEEIDELDEALRENDIVEVADALGDILYLVLGTGVNYGILVPDAPIRLRKAKPNLFPHGDIDLDTKDHVSYVNKIQMLLDMLQIILGNACIDHAASIESTLCLMLRDTLYEMVVLVQTISGAFEIELRDIFFEVHRSNMSKLDENGQPIFRADGKVIKSKLYSPPDIAPILERQRARAA